MAASDMRTKASYLKLLGGHLARRPRDLRSLPEWWRMLRPSPLETRVPWLAFAAATRIESTLQPGSRVFEFGGGGSTAWFTDIGMTVTTAEHDPEWARMIQTAVPDAEVRLVDNYRYPAAIDGEADGSVDLVLVDGVYRVECVRQALSKVSIHGFLVLDDADRPEYAEAFELLQGWPREIFIGLAPAKAIPAVTAVFHR